MNTEPIDPRDTRWESDAPAYRVYFWSRRSDEPLAMWSSDEWRITGADVAEVLWWADEQARGRYVTVWVEHDQRDDGQGLIRLLGWEPTRNDNPMPWIDLA